MVVGLGVDLVEIDRVHEALDRWDGRLLSKLMDPPEAAALPTGGPERARAVAFAVAAKEAASKALGTGWSRGVYWRQVVVDPGPPPRVRLSGRAAEVARARGSSGRGELRLEVRGGVVLGEFRLLSA
jgi:holo-[acyl-carrier protein] synthase